MGAVLALVAAVAFGVAGWFVWTRYVPRSVTSINGQPLGHLPGGIRPSELNLLLVTLDTTRADRIHAYGFNGVETPNLDRLAREGVLFEHAASAAPLTLPAHSSLFTGKFPPDVTGATRYWKGNWSRAEFGETGVRPSMRVPSRIRSRTTFSSSLD